MQNKLNRIMVVDDEESICLVLKSVLASIAEEVHIFTKAEDALNKFKRGEYDVILQDIIMPDLNGIELIKHLRGIDNEVPIIVLTADESWQTAVEAMRLGAYDFIRKPFDNNDLKMRIQRANKSSEMIKKLKEVRKDEFSSFSKMIGTTPSMTTIYETVMMVAKTDTTVLIEGESGTGKELIARWVHFESVRIEKPFIAVNCGAFPENLLESELFGHLKGSFTGAIYDKKGLLEITDGGTFLLDEISDMPLHLQVKLLRVIEEKKFLPVGATTPISVDVRFIAATNKNLEDEVKKNRFREDLFYRLNVIPIKLPALRERKDDIPLLIGFFLSKFNKRLSRKVESISDDAVQALQNYPWHGNVRELENVIERILALSKSDKISVQDLPDFIRNFGYSQVAESSEKKSKIPPKGLNLEEYISNVEKEILVEMLKRCSGSVSKSAELLNLTPRALGYKLKKYNIEKYYG